MNALVWARLSRALRSFAAGVAAFAVLILLWEGYKLIGSPDGWSFRGVRLLPRADDDSMPHVWTVIQRFGQPEVASGAGHSVFVAVLKAAWFSFRVSLAGWLGGTVVGVLLAVLMQRFRTAQDALLPYVIVSQTVPLVAIAPVLTGWGGHILVLGHPWQSWMSVAVISGYLAFFPVAVGMLRGLNSPQAAQLGLMHSYAASWWQTLIRLRLPASVGYLVPALRLGAAASVIGTVVAEISTGTRGGIGRLILEYASAATGDPARPWTAIAGAAALGLVVAGMAGLIDLALARYNPGAGAVTAMTGAAADGAKSVPAVLVRGVDKTFGAGQASAVTALTGIELTIAPGEFVSLIGPSGCGKSTLMRLVADLDQPTAGSVEVFGKTARAARLDQDYGIAFQAAGLLPWRTVRANIELPLELHGASKSARRARATELLDTVGLADFASHRPDQLSGGMQQRVAIARALAEQPRLLLMDEPFGALDEMTRERMQSELVRLSATTGCAVLFVTHSIPEAVFLSQRVVVMSARPGQISATVPIGLGARTEDTREEPAFYAAVTAVREALRGRRVTSGELR